jgi:hypothetical protein
MIFLQRTAKISKGVCPRNEILLSAKDRAYQSGAYYVLKKFYNIDLQELARIGELKT